MLARVDRRSLLLCLAATPAFARAQAGLHAGLHFPADFGAHPETRTEWWYATGSLVSGARLWGFQVTFFRSSTGVKAAAQIIKVLMGRPRSIPSHSSGQLHGDVAVQRESARLVCHLGFGGVERCPLRCTG